MQNSRKWQKILSMFFLSLAVFMAISVLPWNMWFTVSNNLTMLEGEEYHLELVTPLNVHISSSKNGIIQVNDLDICMEGNSHKGPLSLKALQLGQVTLDFRLFGLIPLRQIEVNVLPEKHLIPGGHSIGIKLKADGVMVVGFNMAESDGRKLSPAKDAGIKIGDTITEIDGVPVQDLAMAAELIKEGGRKNKELQVKIRRNSEVLDFSVAPIFCQESRSPILGLFIRDSAAGVGTMTFYEPTTGTYGALGHIIADIDTQSPIDIEHGQIVRADIVNIKAARRGYPGEKNGVFIDEKDVIGNIEKNTDSGIFGTLSEMDDTHPLYRKPLPIGLMQVIDEGPATILTVLEEDNIEEFDIEIVKAYPQGNTGKKDMIIQVTDDFLLEKTGGIVQGMSGSPIIQDGHIVGAVTHVFINEPAKGYGIYIERMLIESDLVEVEG